MIPERGTGSRGFVWVKRQGRARAIRGSVRSSRTHPARGTVGRAPIVVVCMTTWRDLTGELSMILLGLVAGAMAADLLTFALVVPLVGIGAESNPIMAAGYAQFGLVMVILLKAACTVGLMAAVLLVRERRLRVLTAVFAMTFGLLGVLGNVTAWLRT